MNAPEPDVVYPAPGADAAIEFYRKVFGAEEILRARDEQRGRVGTRS